MNALMRKDAVSITLRYRTDSITAARTGVSATERDEPARAVVQPVAPFSPRTSLSVDVAGEEWSVHRAFHVDKAGYTDADPVAEIVYRSDIYKVTSVTAWPRHFVAIGQRAD